MATWKGYPVEAIDSANAQPPAGKKVLYYDEDARKWVEAKPSRPHKVALLVVDGEEAAIIRDPPPPPPYANDTPASYEARLPAEQKKLADSGKLAPKIIRDPPPPPPNASGTSEDVG
jgi:hypothetical protein